jgi:DNA-binding NarL/FixJ family response regulator
MDKLDRLTPREREVLALLAGAETNGAIADDLGITTRAVERHVNSIFRKLEIPTGGRVNRRVQAALTYRDA